MQKKILIIEDSTLLTNFMYNEISSQFFYEIVTVSSLHAYNRILRKESDHFFVHLLI